MTGQLAVGLFRPRRVQIAGAQARLHVSNRDTLIKSRQAGRQRGGCVTVDQHHIRLEFFQNAFQAFQNATGNLTQSLAGLHDVQIVIRHDFK
ncbi:hypothetical protein D3C79_999810 [compost metagenome]